MISVIVPAFNEEKLIAGCLESLTNQDYSDEYEIIVVDNGSTDKTNAIARTFRVRIVPGREKKSVFYARQVGADAAKGDILVQADGDTVYPRDWLTRIAQHFARHPEVVAIAGRFYYRDPPFWHKIEYWLRHRFNNLTINLLGLPLVISGAAFAFRREAFVQVNGYHSLTYGADQYGIASQLSKVGKVFYDKNLIAATSSRRMNKPRRDNLKSVPAATGRWFIKFFQCCNSALQIALHKTLLRRMITRLMPAVIVVAAVIVYAYFIPSSPVFGHVLYKGNPGEKVVALTFDDGPNDPYTSQVLDVLEKYNVKATFFLIGENVQTYPDTTKRILADGNVIGNHSYSHNADHAVTTYGSKDMIQAETAISMVAGVMPHLYRPPHGRKSPWEIESAKKQNMAIITWSIASGELIKQTPENLAASIIKKTSPGGIILMHDGYGTLHNVGKANKAITAEALSIIIEQLQAQGYKFVTVPELFNIPAYNN